MAVLNYLVTQSASHALNEHLTTDFDLSQGEQWYPYSTTQNSRVSDGIAYRLTSQLPVSTVPRQLDYVVAQSYVDDFYYRIHIDTLEADLGVVASKQVITFNLWNAYFEHLDLKRIEGLGVGSYFEQDDLAPLTLFALQERAWKLHILPDGDARLNLDLRWLFDGQKTGEHYSVGSLLSGQRVIGFAWQIDWANGVSESLAWHTDILQSQTGHEQRRSLRLSPRLTLDVDLLLHQRERTLFDLTIVGWSSKTFVIPLWFYQSHLRQDIANNSLKIACNTANMPYADYQYVMLVKSAFEYEVAEVHSVNDGQIILKRPLQNAWTVGTHLYPAVSAFIRQQPQLKKRNSETMRTSVQFQALDTVGHVKNEPKNIDYFLDYPVLNLAPNEQNDLTHSYQRLQQQLDNVSGRPLLVDIANASFMLYQYRWFLQDIEQHEQFYAWLNLLNGRQKAVWIPTFSDDLQLASTIQSASKNLDILYCGYTKFAQNQTGRQHILITLKTGERLYHKIIDSQELGQIERLTVATAFAQNIAINDILNIQFISLCRLNNDNVNIQHHNDINGLATVEMTFRGVRED